MDLLTLSAPCSFGRKLSRFTNASGTIRGWLTPLRSGVLLPSQPRRRLLGTPRWSELRIGLQPYAHVLNLVGILPQARYVAYFSVQPNWSDSIDMADALHPQTLVTYAMNGSDLPLRHGGPLRLRVPRQLGYKSVKYITRLTVTDSLKNFAPEGGYSWYAGI